MGSIYAYTRYYYNLSISRVVYAKAMAGEQLKVASWQNRFHFQVPRDLKRQSRLKSGKLALESSWDTPGARAARRTRSVHRSVLPEVAALSAPPLAGWGGACGGPGEEAGHVGAASAAAAPPQVPVAAAAAASWAESARGPSGARCPRLPGSASAVRPPARPPASRPPAPPPTWRHAPVGRRLRS